MTQLYSQKTTLVKGRDTRFPFPTHTGKIMQEDKDLIERQLLSAIQKIESSGSLKQNDGFVYSGLASYYASRKRVVEAEDLYKKALDCLDLGIETPSHLPVFGGLAAVYKSLGKYKEAELIIERWLGFYEQYGGGNTLDAAELLDRRARLCELQNDFSRAEFYKARSAAIRIAPDES